MCKETETGGKELAARVEEDVSAATTDAAPFAELDMSEI